MRRLLTAVTLGCLSTAPLQSAVAESDYVFSGEYAASAGLDARSSSPESDALDVLNRLTLSLRRGGSEGLRAKVATRLTHRTLVQRRGAGWGPRFESDATRMDFEVETLEAWIHVEGDAGALTIGNQLVPWGALELASPLRLWNPMDLRYGLLLATDPEASHLPSFLVKAVRRFGPIDVMAVIQPFFTQHRFSAVATDTALLRPDLGAPLPPDLERALRHIDPGLDRALGDNASLALRSPDESLRNVSGGVQVGARTWGVDWALSYAFLWDHTPVLDTDSSTVTATWRRRHTFGLQAAGALFGAWQARLDAALSPSRVLFDTTLRPLERPVAIVAAGLEWQPDTTFVAMLEASHQHVFDMPRDRGLFLLSPDQTNIAALVRGSLLDGDSLELQFAAIWGVSKGDRLVSPKVSWRASDAWLLSLAAVLSGGPVDSPAGLFKSNDQVFVISKVAF